MLPNIAEALKSLHIRQQSVSSSQITSIFCNHMIMSKLNITGNHQKQELSLLFQYNISFQFSVIDFNCNFLKSIDFMKGQKCVCKALRFVLEREYLT